jgi:membrane protein DedA with SNARE-associated domain
VGQVRRAPKYPAFVLSGALLGVLIGVLLGLIGSSAVDVSQASLLGYLAALCALLGGVIGAAAALIIERRRPSA